MILENFKVKTESEYNALSAEEKGEYNAMFKMYQADQKAKAEAKLKEDLKAELQKDYDTVLAEKMAEIKANQSEEAKKAEEELNAKIEKLEAKLQRIGLGGDRNERQKTMSDLIEAKFSTDEGEQMIKDFISGTKKSLATELTVEKAIFSTPVGSVPAQFTPIVSPNYQRVHVRDILSVFPTMSNMITYLRLAPTAGTGIAVVGEGVTKPEIQYTPTVVQAPVKKIAGYLNVTMESIEDVPGFRAWIASELPKAYLLAEDLYILKDAEDGIFTLAEDWEPQGSVDLSSNPWDRIIAGMTQIRKVNGYPTAVWVSPIGRQELVINKDYENAYSYPIALGDDGVLRVDGVPVYTSNSFVDGEFLVGDFNTDSVTLHQRQSWVVKYSDEHANNFIDNLVTFLIEGRVVVAVRKPYNFVKGELQFTPTT